MLTRGAGLIVGVLVARYLGPAALGSYAVIMALAQVFEAVSPLGQRYVVIREVARDRSLLFAYWLDSSLMTAGASLVLSLALVVLVHVIGYDASTRTSAYVVALYLPVAGLYLVAQSVVQGLEEMEYLTISALVGRVLGLLVLWLLLRSGMGVAAAFIGRGLFQLVALLILVWAVARPGKQRVASRAVRFSLARSRALFRAALPFAGQDFLRMALERTTTVILPLVMTLAAVGMFDAADRVRQTSAMIIPIVTMAILPTLSRTFVQDRHKSATLLEKALKLLLIVILPFAFVVAIAADWIVPLLYGSGYEAAVPVLRIVVWSQVFFVADAVLNQIMMASNHERPMVRRTAITLAASVVLTLLLAPRYGALGAAWTVVLTRALNLGLDAQFVTKRIMRIDAVEAVGKPLVCAALAGAVAFALRGQGLYILLAGAAIVYAVLLFVVGAISRDELLLARRLSRYVRNSVGARIR